MYEFSILLILFLLVPFATADPQIGRHYIRCENETYPKGNAFESNLRRVLVSLAANVADTGFQISSYPPGDTANKTYGVVQCRGDLSPSDCQVCASYAKDYLLTHCSQISATLALAGCFLQNENYDFFSERTPAYILYYVEAIAPQLDATIAQLLSGVVSKAVASVNRFAANITFLPYGSIYALAQCWLNLSKEVCRECLVELNDQLYTWYSEGKIGLGYAISSGCLLQYSVYPFFNLAVLSGSPRPALQSEAWVTRQICGDNIYEKGSTFEKQLGIVLDSLVMNVSKTGFSNFSYGENGSKIYGLAQCRGDLNAAECSACVSIAKQNILQACPTLSATNILFGCFLRYENYKFYSGWEKDATWVVCSDEYSDNKTEFDKMIGPIVDNLVKNATSNNGFSTAEDNLTLGAGSPLTTIYSLAQCWEDLDMNVCRDCLEYASNTILQNCNSGDLRRLVMSYNCYLRYGTVKFFHGPPLQLSSSPSTITESSSPKLPEIKRGSNHSKLRVILATSISATAIFLVVLALILQKGRAMSCLNRKSILQHEIEDNSTAVSEAVPKSELNFQFETFESCTGNFNPANKLGQGGFGSVYKGDLPDGTEIAVKRLFSNRAQDVRQFLNEVNIISQVRHKNLVKLLGCSVKGHERLLVYEYLPNNSLDHHLFDSIKNKILSWEKRFEIIVGTAAGLAYLHRGFERCIIHRDIKASNVLLDQNFKPKIADFGLANCFSKDQSHISTGVAGTCGYMAPECIAHDQFTEKADVFSFGILVLEIISGRKNNHSSSGENLQSLPQLVWMHYRLNTVSRIIDPTIIETAREEAALYLAVRVGLLCTQASPALRPSMSQVVQMLINNDPYLPVPAQPPFMNLEAAVSDSQPLLSSASSVTDSSEPL